MSDQPLPAFDQIPGIATQQYLADIHAQSQGSQAVEQATVVNPAPQLAPVVAQSVPSPAQTSLAEAQTMPTQAEPAPATIPFPEQAPATEQTHDLAEHRRRMREAADLGAEAVQAVQTAPLPANEIPAFLR